MIVAKEFLLLGAAAAIGFLHTVVPDHWVPITLLARERGWSQGETAGAAFAAGAGHVVSTLVIAFLAAALGIAFAAGLGGLLDVFSSLALVLFGGAIALLSWREIHSAKGGENEGKSLHDNEAEGAFAAERAAAPFAQKPFADALYLPLGAGAQAVLTHTHTHRHGKGKAHTHFHDHDREGPHPAPASSLSEPPLHRHSHPMPARATLLLILGSSPMVEGIPAFFAAAKYGLSFLALMAALFAASTIATYVGLSLFSLRALERVRLGPVERYGEVLSGALIALLGLLFALLSLHSGGFPKIAA